MPMASVYVDEFEVSVPIVNDTHTNLQHVLSASRLMESTRKTMSKRTPGKRHLLWISDISGDLSFGYSVRSECA